MRGNWNWYTWMGIIALLVGALPQQLAGQCNDPAPPGTGPNACDQAPVFCSVSELDGYCSSFSNTGVGICPPPFCGSCENYHFLGFVANSNSISLLITPSNCSGTPDGTGVQAQIYETSNCSSFTAVSNCQSPGVEVPLQVDAINLTIGETYYLMIDGWAGDACDYEITVLAGGGELVPPQIIGGIDGIPEVCPGSELTYQVTTNPGATNVDWSITPAIGSVAAGATTDSVTISWNSPGTAQLCATPYNDCEEGPPVCTVISSNFIPTTIFQEDLCFGDIVECGGQVYSTPGVFTNTYTSTLGCDSVVTCIINPIFPGLTFIDTVVCAGACFEIADTSFCETGAHSYTIPNGSVQGCDSTITLILNVMDAETLTPDAEELDCADGSSVQLQPLFATALNDTIPESSVSYEWTGPGIMGPTDQFTAEADQEGLYIFTVLHERFDLSCTASDTIIVTLTSIPLTERSAMICPGDSLLFGSVYYDTTGIYFDTLIAQNGCDSIVELQLGLLENDQNQIVLQLCDGQQVTIGDNTYGETGMYSDTLTNIEGCDSIVQLDLTVASEFFIARLETLCFGDSIQIGDSTYKESGFYLDTLLSFFGCDSIIELDLTVLPDHPITQIDTTICSGNLVTIAGQTFDETGLYEISLANVNGCDSIVQLQLTAHPAPLTFIQDTICFGDEYLFNDQLLNESGTYITSALNEFGCDSTIALDLFVRPPNIEYFFEEICEGDSLFFGGSSFFEAGSYLLEWENDHDCDSFNLLNLTVFEENVSEFELEVCEPGIYEVNGKNYLAPGTYTETNTNQEGCDSILQIHLFLGDGPVLANSAITPDDGTMNGAITVEIEGGVPPYTYHWNADGMSNQITGLEAGLYELTVTDAYDCSATFSFEVDLTSAQYSLIQEAQIRFFPNPVSTQSMAYVEIQASVAERVHLSLADSRGKVFLSKTAPLHPSETRQIPLSIVTPPGVYFLQIQVGELLKVEKVVVF
jgi:hypothetical protein